MLISTAVSGGLATFDGGHNVASGLTKRAGRMAALINEAWVVVKAVLADSGAGEQ